MTIQVRRDTGFNGMASEVLIFTSSGGFSSDELFKKLEYAFTLAQSRGTTFLGVIDTNYQIRSGRQFVDFFDEFKFINELPREEPEYRICLIVDSSNTREEAIFTSLQNSESPNSLSEWIIFLAKGVGGVMAAKDMMDQLEHLNYHPLVNNPWVSTDQTVEGAIQWCRENASWT